MTLQPEAWLIRQTRNGKTSIVYGHMFMTAEKANAAALRMTNGWRLCVAFPVVGLFLAKAEIEQARKTPVDEPE